MQENEKEIHNAEPSQGQVDDINIPLVAVSVAFFACLLVVTIVSLQAWFMNAQRAEIAAQTLKQEDPRDPAILASGKDANGAMKTERGQNVLQQRAQLYVAPADRKMTPAAPEAKPATTTASAPASAPAKKLWISIDEAMAQVSKEYRAEASK